MERPLASLSARELAAALVDAFPARLDLAPLSVAFEANSINAQALIEASDSTLVKLGAMSGLSQQP